MVKTEFVMALLLAVTILLAGIGVLLFVLAGVPWAAMQKLLKEGDRVLRDRKAKRLKEAFSTIFWLLATAVYLGWSFLTNDWEITWVVWPIAGILFAVSGVFLNWNNES